VRLPVRIARTARFKKAWEKLNERERTLARKAITNLARDIRYSALRTKKMQGTDYIWEARASLSLRITFQIEGDTIILRNIGHHDEALGQP
jgi:mRNA-degrading endonuclease RelE of RelBE toxin-antitoxin system